MGFLDNIFGDKKDGGSRSNNNNNKNNNNNNPLANMRKNIEQTMGGNKNRTMSGPGRSLGGSKPGTVYPVVLAQPGPVGIRVEKRSTNSASAIVHTVVTGSQAEAAGLQRGDVLCFAGSNGQEEMPYEMFLEIAKSPQRPIHLEARRFDQSSSPGIASSGSADAEARRRAVIAAAERRNKQHKSQTKTIKHVTKSTLLKQQQETASNAAVAAGPQTEESRKAAAAAKRGEANTIHALGYNPYESIKKTAGQARAATTTTQHGAIAAPGGGGGGAAPSSEYSSIPPVAPPSDLSRHAAADHSAGDDDPRFHDFEIALATIASSQDSGAAKNGLKIARKLVTNATTKGQQNSGADAEKFRRVRLANPKIKAAVVDVPGNLDLMLSVGFALVPDETAPDESLLVFPPGTSGPSWLSRALVAMETTETQLVVTSTL